MIVLTGPTLEFHRIEIHRPWWAVLLRRPITYRWMIKDHRFGLVATGETLPAACRQLIALRRSLMRGVVIIGRL